MNEIAGVSLDDLEEPIQDALLEYEYLSQRRLGLEVVRASELELTPDKPNSARSATPVTFDEERVGDLYVIAFKPGDGSGDEKTFRLEDLEVAPGLPRAAKVVPRSKAAVHSEGLLSVVSHKIDAPNTDPELFKGNFELLSLDGNLIKKIGELGHDATIEAEEATPLATFTVGYNADGRRFGDPHAIFSSLPDAVQVCAFLAVSDEAYKQHPEIFQSLRTQEPRRV